MRSLTLIKREKNRFIGGIHKTTILTNECNHTNVEFSPIKIGERYGKLLITFSLVILSNLDRAYGKRIYVIS